VLLMPRVSGCRSARTGCRGSASARVVHQPAPAQQPEQRRGQPGRPRPAGRRRVEVRQLCANTSRPRRLAIPMMLELGALQLSCSFARLVTHSAEQRRRMRSP